MAALPNKSISNINLDSIGTPEGEDDRMRQLDQQLHSLEEELPAIKENNSEIELELSSTRKSGQAPIKPPKLNISLIQSLSEAFDEHNKENIDSHPLKNSESQRNSRNNFEKSTSILKKIDQALKENIKAPHRKLRISRSSRNFEGRRTTYGSRRNSNFNEVGNLSLQGSARGRRVPRQKTMSVAGGNNTILPEDGSMCADEELEFLKKEMELMKTRLKDEPAPDNFGISPYKRAESRGSAGRLRRQNREALNEYKTKSEELEVTNFLLGVEVLRMIQVVKSYNRNLEDKDKEVNNLTGEVKTLKEELKLSKAAGNLAQNENEDQQQWKDQVIDLESQLNALLKINQKNLEALKFKRIGQEKMKKKIDDLKLDNVVCKMQIGSLKSEMEVLKNLNSVANQGILDMKGLEEVQGVNSRLEHENSELKDKCQELEVQNQQQEMFASVLDQKVSEMADVIKQGQLKEQNYLIEIGEVQRLKIEKEEMMQTVENYERERSEVLKRLEDANSYFEGIKSIFGGLEDSMGDKSDPKHSDARFRLISSIEAVISALNIQKINKKSSNLMKTTTIDLSSRNKTPLGDILEEEDEYFDNSGPQPIGASQIDPENRRKFMSSLCTLMAQSTSQKESNSSQNNTKLDVDYFHAQTLVKNPKKMVLHQGSETHNLLSENIDNLSSELKNSSQEILTLQVQRNEYSMRVKNLESDLSAQNTLKTENQQEYLLLNKEQSEKIQNYKIQNEELESKLSDIINSREILREENDKLGSELENMRRVVSYKEVEIEEMEVKLRSEKDRQVKQVVEIASQTDLKEFDIEGLQQANKDLGQRVEDWDYKAELLTQEVQVLQQENRAYLDDNSLKEEKLKILGLQIVDLQEELTLQKDQYTEIQVSMQEQIYVFQTKNIDQNSEIEGLQQQIIDQETGFKEQEAYSVLECQKLNSEIESLTFQVSSSKTKYDSLYVEFQTSIDTINHLQKDNEALPETITTQMKEINDLRLEITQIKTKKIDQENELNKASSQVQSLQDKIQNLEEYQVPLLKSLNDSKNEVRDLQTQLKSSTTQKIELTSQIEELTSKLNTSYKESDDNHSSYDQKCHELINLTESTHKNIEELTNEVQLLTEKFDQKNEEFQILNEKLETLKTQNSSLDQDNKDRNDQEFQEKLLEKQKEFNKKIEILTNNNKEKISKIEETSQELVGKAKKKLDHEKSKNLLLEQIVEKLNEDMNVISKDRDKQAEKVIFQESQLKNSSKQLQAFQQEYKILKEKFDNASDDIVKLNVKRDQMESKMLETVKFFEEKISDLKIINSKKMETKEQAHMTEPYQIDRSIHNGDNRVENDDNKQLGGVKENVDISVLKAVREQILPILLKLKNKKQDSQDVLSSLQLNREKETGSMNKKSSILGVEKVVVNLMEMDSSFSEEQESKKDILLLEEEKVRAPIDPSIVENYEYLSKELTRVQNYIDTLIESNKDTVQKQASNKTQVLSSEEIQRIENKIRVEISEEYSQNYEKVIKKTQDFKKRQASFKKKVLSHLIQLIGQIDALQEELYSIQSTTNKERSVMSNHLSKMCYLFEQEAEVAPKGTIHELKILKKKGYQLSVSTPRSAKTQKKREVNERQDSSQKSPLKQVQDKNHQISILEEKSDHQREQIKILYTQNTNLENSLLKKEGLIDQLNQKIKEQQLRNNQILNQPEKKNRECEKCVQLLNENNEVNNQLNLYRSQEQSQVQKVERALKESENTVQDLEDIIHQAEIRLEESESKQIELQKDLEVALNEKIRLAQEYSQLQTMSESKIGQLQEIINQQVSIMSDKQSAITSQQSYIPNNSTNPRSQDLRANNYQPSCSLDIGDLCQDSSVPNYASYSDIVKEREENLELITQLSLKLHNQEDYINSLNRFNTNLQTELNQYKRMLKAYSQKLTELSNSKIEKKEKKTEKLAMASLNTRVRYLATENEQKDYIINNLEELLSQNQQSCKQLKKELKRSQNGNSPNSQDKVSLVRYKISQLFGRMDRQLLKLEEMETGMSRGIRGGEKNMNFVKYRSIYYKLIQEYKGSSKNYIGSCIDLCQETIEIFESLQGVLASQKQEFGKKGGGF